MDSAMTRLDGVGVDHLGGSKSALTVTLPASCNVPYT